MTNQHTAYYRDGTLKPTLADKIIRYQRMGHRNNWIARTLGVGKSYVSRVTIKTSKRADEILWQKEYSS